MIEQPTAPLPHSHLLVLAILLLIGINLTTIPVTQAAPTEDIYRKIDQHGVPAFGDKPNKRKHIVRAKLEELKDGYYSSPSREHAFMQTVKNYKLYRMADSQGETALFYAARHGHKVAIGHLLKNGADIHHRNHKGLSIIHYANGLSLPIVKLLLASGSDVNATTRRGNTVLIEAVKDNGNELVTALLKHGADVNAQDAKGRTALLFAVNEENPDIIEQLLAAGADPWLGPKRETPMALAARQGDQALVAQLSQTPNAATSDNTSTESEVDNTPEATPATSYRKTSRNRGMTAALWCLALALWYPYLIRLLGRYYRDNKLLPPIADDDIILQHESKIFNDHLVAMERSAWESLCLFAISVGIVSLAGSNPYAPAIPCILFVALRTLHPFVLVLRGDKEQRLVHIGSLVCCASLLIIAPLF